ncbi:MAG: hypothetical protein ACR2IE_17370 [Candidatus Sumerlaeaceae bacterium]
MIITDGRMLEKLERMRAQPFIPWIKWDLVAMLAEIRREHFPELATEVDTWFVRQPTLACITTREGSPQATIYIHNILNHPDTPREVFSMILKHELLHLLIPPMEVDGKRVQHPEEFWEAEHRIAPERQDGWLWIRVTFWHYLRERPKLECIQVKRGWEARWSEPHMSVEEAKRLFGRLPVREAEVC